jgi:hypothetical protein
MCEQMLVMAIPRFHDKEHTTLHANKIEQRERESTQGVCDHVCSSLSGVESE